LQHRRIRTTRREAGAALAAALFLAGCGSGDERAAPSPPRLPAALAAQLASRSDDVARLLRQNDGCSALAAAKALQRETIAAVNARRVPARFQEPLLGAANDLVFRIHCAPSPAASAPADEARHGEGKHHKGKGEHKGGKHGRRGDRD
jgi:hypothetical protein